MNKTLNYDKTTKQLIKDRIHAFLYDPVEKQFQDRINILIRKNSVLCGNSQVWMSHKGVYYTMDTTTLRPKPINKLKPELQVFMDEYLKDKEQLNYKELPHVMGYINQVLNLSSSLQDYLKLLPESLHPPIKELMEHCACREDRLNQQVIQRVNQTNQVPIELIKKRMVLNLLI